MEIHHAHPWNVSPGAAIDIQRQLSSAVITTDQLGKIQFVAGVDVGFEKMNTVTRAAIAVLSFPGLELIETAIARTPVNFPYIPGLLSFRELPAVLKALHKLAQLPDLVLCDGQGYAHPRRFGIACHLGVLSGLPTIGVGKSRLLGTHQPVADRRGAWQPLIDRDETVGAVLRSRTGVKPIYISSGHRISLETAVHYVMACTTRYKLPETTRYAHHYASNI